MVKEKGFNAFLFSITAGRLRYNPWSGSVQSIFVGPDAVEADQYRPIAARSQPSQHVQQVSC